MKLTVWPGGFAARLGGGVMKGFSLNAWIGVGFIVFAAFVQFVGIPNYISVPGNVPMATLSPRYWPRVICGMMMFLGAAQIIAAYLDAKYNVASKERATIGLSREDAVKIAGIVILLFSYYVAVKYLGFLISTMLFVPVMAYVYGERRIIALILLCAVPGPTLYLFFSRVAYTTFEPGILFS